VLYTVHFTAFSLGGRFFPDTVYIPSSCWDQFTISDILPNLQY